MAWFISHYCRVGQHDKCTVVSCPCSCNHERATQDAREEVKKEAAK